MTRPWANDDRLDAALLDFLTDEAAHVPGIPGTSEMTTRIERGLRPLRWPAWLAGGLRLAATGGAAIAVVAAIVWFRGQPGPQVGGTPPPPSPSSRPSPSQAAGDLLAQVRDRGAIRLAIRPDFPQAQAGGFEGFDIDVANALAGHLGLRAEPQFFSVEEMLPPNTISEIDAAMPSDVLAASDPNRFLASEPYYHWPVFLVVPEASSATAPPDLAGRVVCVMAGSSGDAWLGGGYLGPSSTPVAAPPANVTTRREATDRDCLAALGRGEVDALVSATLTNADFATRSLRRLGGPVLTEPRSIVAQRAGPDPAALIDEVDRVLSEMRTDGTLVSFSQNRFGGNDLTAPSTP